MYENMTRRQDKTNKYGEVFMMVKGKTVGHELEPGNGKGAGG